MPVNPVHLGSFGGFDMPEDELKLIVPSHGPYRGQRITVSVGDADAAISEGWATDPFALTAEPKEGEAAPELEDEDMRAKRIEQAEAAARRWRGEEEETGTTGKQKTRDMQADKPSATYQTRAAAEPEPERRGPGRPPKAKEES
jgi:hypothetical protein